MHEINVFLKKKVTFFKEPFIDRASIFLYRKLSRSNTIAPNGTSLHPNVHTPRDKERI